MIGKMLGALALSVLVLAIYLFFYLGLSKPVQIEVGRRGPFVMVYQNHLGAYHQIGPAIAAVEKWANDLGLRCALTFGEYLDDPAAVDQDRLRSRGGCLFDQSTKAALTPPAQFTLEERPSKRYVIGIFKGAPSAGPFKVYPKVHEYLEAQRLKSTGPVIETYSIHGDNVTTEYLFPLE